MRSHVLSATLKYEFTISSYLRSAILCHYGKSLSELLGTLRVVIFGLCKWQ